MVSRLVFSGKWRSYQMRVLYELEHHLEDEKLNIVAAPGAGKTTLGIEVVSRLGQNTLILAPTITIKNQWKQRIIDNFLSPDCDTGFISADIENVGIITISTYQNIHSIYKDRVRREKLINDLKKNRVETIVLDEAHHLRTEWYSTLNALCAELKNENFRVVSLTGTPPYDVSPSEWGNYHELCGPVDAEISVPELVKAGDLCPHRDLIYFSEPAAEEKELVENFEKRREKFFEYIHTSSDFHYLVESSPFICDLENHTELIYEDTSFTVALISYVLSEDYLSVGARYLIEFLELELTNIPKFNYTLAETLIEGMLGKFKTYFKNTNELRSKLKELELIHGNKADFTGCRNFKRLYSESRNKLYSIKKITEVEYGELKNALREVVLTDYIGKGRNVGLNVLSVFETLLACGVNLGILTGNLVVIPANAKDTLADCLKARNIDVKKVLTAEFKPGYLRLEVFGNVDIVSIVTEIFERGKINVMIGTAALLGEGWDSPCVNTLVIASTVGSFMLSNQMRGRALRTDKNNPNKTSDIWHLVSLDKNSSEFFDLFTVKKRFKTFEGISYDNSGRIQSGIERLALNLDDPKNLNCKKLNDKNLTYARSRKDLKNQWKQAFNQSELTEKGIAPLMYDVVENSERQNSIIVKQFPKWCGPIEKFVESSSIYTKKKQKNFVNKIILKLAARFGYVNKDYETYLDKNYRAFEEQTMLENFAKALLNTLCEISAIKTDYVKLALRTEKTPDKNFYITLAGCSNYERHIFIKAFEEIFKVDSGYRYILKKFDKYLGVPSVIGVKAKYVKIFVKCLQEVENDMYDIIFTRNPQGYKELLKAGYNLLQTSEMKSGRIWI